MAILFFGVTAIFCVGFLSLYLTNDTARRGPEGAFVETVNRALEDHYEITYLDFKTTMDFIGDDRELNRLFLQNLPDDLIYFLDRYIDDIS